MRFSSLPPGIREAIAAAAAGAVNGAIPSPILTVAPAPTSERKANTGEMVAHAEAQAASRSDRMIYSVSRCDSASAPDASASASDAIALVGYCKISIKEEHFYVAITYV